MSGITEVASALCEAVLMLSVGGLIVFAVLFSAAKLNGN
jgi:hypothetical protein